MAVMMIQSDFRIPYHTHIPSPATSTQNIPNETFSALFSRHSFNSCGNEETAVEILAMIPTMVVVFISDASSSSIPGWQYPLRKKFPVFYVKGFLCGESATQPTRNCRSGAALF